MNRPRLMTHARLRWDATRRQHELVYPEGLLVLNAPAAAVVERCDGRTRTDLLASLAGRFTGVDTAEVDRLLDDLGQRGLLRDDA